MWLVAVCLWADSHRRFLTASRGVCGIRWWRGSGIPLVSRGGGGVGRWSALLRQSRATAKVKSLKSASGGACAASGLAPGSGGPRWLPADAACGRLRPGFPVASSPNGSRPARWYQVGSQNCGSSISDLTPPARPAWLRPPKRRGIRDKPACGKSSRTSRTHRLAAAVPHRVDPVHTTDRGCPGFPVASAVLAQPSRPGRCPAGRGATTAACDPAGHRPGRDGSLRALKRRGIRDRGDHKQRPAASSATPTPRSEAARRAGAAGGACKPLTLPVAVALDCRSRADHLLTPPPPRETSTTTDPRRQRIPQTPREAVKKRL
ncbi:hypothetical protein ABIA31_001601 [Catenulispora sp. MAP5-51]